MKNFPRLAGGLAVGLSLGLSVALISPVAHISPSHAQPKPAAGL